LIKEIKWKKDHLVEPRFIEKKMFFVCFFVIWMFFVVFVFWMVKLTERKRIKAWVTHGGVGPPRGSLTSAKSIRIRHEHTHTHMHQGYYKNPINTFYGLQ